MTRIRFTKTRIYADFYSRNTLKTSINFYLIIQKKSVPIRVFAERISIIRVLFFATVKKAKNSRTVSQNP